MDKKHVLLGLAIASGIGAGLGARLLFHRTTAPAATQAAPAPTAAPLPSLDESADVLRSKAAGLSADSRWNDWLKTEEPLRRAAAAIDLIASGKVPRDALAFLSPRKRFAAGPTGYARYDRVAGVIATIDASSAAKLLKDLNPLFEQACREFGGSACAYPDAFVRAANHLIEAPLASPMDRLKPAAKGIAFVYVDERLERLSPAQKQLMRMGPKNQGLIQAKLREVVVALSAITP